MFTLRKEQPKEKDPVTQSALAFPVSEQACELRPAIDLCERIYARNFSQNMSVQDAICQDWSELLA